MITAHRHSTLANAGKTAALVALVPAFGEALGGLGSLTRRELLNGLPLSGWRVMSKDSLAFAHRVSARQMKSVQNMTHAAVSGWQQSLLGRVRELITGSTLPEHRKTVLYRINARKAWWSKELCLPWSVDPVTGELIPCTDGMDFAAHDTYASDGAMIDRGAAFAASHLGAPPASQATAVTGGGFGN